MIDGVYDTCTSHGKQLQIVRQGNASVARRDGHTEGVRQPDRVGYTGLRPCILPHHRAYRFRYTTVGCHACSAQARSEGSRKPYRRNVALFRAACSEGKAADGQAPLLLPATLS